MALKPGFRAGYVQKRKRTRPGERVSWWARIVWVDENGKRHEQRKRASSKEDAKERVKILLEEADKTQGKSLAVGGKTWEQWCDDYKKTHLVPLEVNANGGHLIGHKPKSLESLGYQLELLKTAREFAGKQLRAITAKDLERFRNRRAIEETTRRCLCPCPDCKTETKKGCQACEGKGRILSGCKLCRGTGRVPNPRRCPDCTYKTAKTCKTCSGTRKVPRQRAVGSTNRELAQLSRIFNLAKSEKLIVESPFVAGKLKQPEKPRSVVLSREDEVRLLSALPDTLGGRRLRLVIITCVDTGMRLGEVKAMRWADVDFSAGTIYIPAKNAKTNREREVPMSSRLRAELLSWRKFHNTGDGPIIGAHSNLHRLWEAARRRAGLMHMRVARTDFGPLRIHDLRHTCAGRLQQSGIGLGEIANVLGHTDLTSLRMTLGYANADAGTYARAVAAMDAFHSQDAGATVN